MASTIPKNIFNRGEDNMMIDIKCVQLSIGVKFENTWKFFVD